MLAKTPPLAFAVIIYCNDIEPTSTLFGGYSQVLRVCLIHLHYSFKLHTDNSYIQPFFKCCLPPLHLFSYI